MTEREFDTRMDETEDARRYWQGELDRLKELRDNAVKVQNGLEYATELLTSLQARLPEIDQMPEELTALPKEQQESILRERQDIIRALCEKVIVWSDRRVKLVGVIDGSEAAQFDLKRPRWYLPKLHYWLDFSLADTERDETVCDHRGIAPGHGVFA